MHFQRAIQFILNRKLFFVVILGLATLGGLIQTLIHLRVDNSLSIWFLDNNPDYQEYLQFQAEQGSDEIIIAMVPTEDALSQTHIQTLQQLHAKIDSLDFVNATFSIANAKYPVYSRRKIVYRKIATPSRSRNGTQALLSQLPSVKAQLVSDDHKFSFFYIQLVPTNHIESDRKAIVEQITRLIESTIDRPYISGPPILNEAYNDTIYEESIFFAVMTVVVMLGLLLFLLPSWRYLPIALLAIVVPVSISLGLMTSMGYALNLISMLIPSVLMVYSISDVIHIINIYHLHRQENSSQSKHQQIKKALQKSLKPCFYTTLTTVIGYLALYLSPLPAFKVMGGFTFLGLLIAFCLVYVITAIGFDFLANKPVTGGVKKINIQTLVQKTNHWTTHKNGIIIGTGIILFAIGLISLFFIEVNTDSLHLLGKGKVKTDLRLIEETLGGSARLQLNISSQESQSLLSEKELEKLKLFQEKLVSHPLIVHPISIVNFQTFLERRTPLADLRVVSFEELLKNSQVESNAFFSLFSPDYSQLAININIKELETKDLEQILLDTETAFKSIYSTDKYNLKVHGFSALYAQLNKFILQTQFRSFGAAFLVSFCILFYFIGKFKMSLLALIPNLLPLFLTMILMVIAGIDLEAANAMLAPIMLGIAMDDTIHLMNKFKLNLDAGLQVHESMNKALSYTGGALFSTTISLVCGFLIVGLSQVVSVSIFGLLCAFTILSALFADIVLLPALMKRFLD